jgi:hypothetical protein
MMLHKVLSIKKGQVYLFTGDQRMRSEDLGQPVSRSLTKLSTTFSAAQGRSGHFRIRPFATTSLLQR